MTLEALETDDGRTRAHQIADLLARRILDGGYAVGDKLPTERELATEYHTNRNAIREAVKRLEGIGMVRVRQGSGIYVDELQLHGSVQLFDVLLTQGDGSPNLKFLRDVIELRGNIMRIMVRAAAVRRTPEQLEMFRRITEARRNHTDDIERLRELAQTLYRTIAEATQNSAYMFLFNTTFRTHLQLWHMLDMPLNGVNRLQDTMECLLVAFETRDAVAAELAVVRLMESLQRALFGEADPAQSSPFPLLNEPAN